MQSIDVSKYNGTINNLTVNGVLTATGGVKSGYYLASASATQTYTSNSLDVQYPTVILNSLTNLTVSGTGNTTYTYTGTTAKVWMINYSIRFQATSNAAGTFIGGSILKGGVQYGQQWYNFAQPSGTETRGALNAFCAILMQPNESFSISVSGTTGATFSENASTRISTLCIIG